MRELLVEEKKARQCVGTLFYLTTIRCCFLLAHIDVAHLDDSAHVRRSDGGK